MFLESLFPTRPKRPPIGPLKAGDILVKGTDNSWTNIGITIAQTFGGAGLYAGYTHAGIATSPRMIAEMDGHGLQHHDLAVGNAGYTYAVFRTRYADVASGAAETAKMMFGFHDSGRLTYSKTGAATSLVPSTARSRDRNRINGFLDQMLTGKEVSLFCSELVVFCYVVALEQSGLLPAKTRPDLPGMSTFFEYEPQHYSPAYLFEMLRKTPWFEYIGAYRGMRWV